MKLEQAGSGDMAPGSGEATVYARIAAEAEAMLHDHVLAKWFPLAVDPRGGFRQDFDGAWQPAGGEDVFSLVHQARLTWTAAVSAAAFPGVSHFAAMARHGLAFLRHRLWDNRRGGFFWEVDAAGPAAARCAGEKHVYGIAFG